MTTKAVADEIVRLAKAGFMDVEIAERLGISAYKAGYYRRKAKVPAARNKNPNNKPDEALIAQMQARTEEGWPPGEIARTLRVGLDSVRTWCDTKQNWRDWNKVARWASRHHPDLYKELIA